MSRLMNIIHAIWRVFASFARTIGRGIVGITTDIGYVIRYSWRGARLFAGDLWSGTKYVTRYIGHGAVGFASDARRLTAWGRARGPAIRTGAGYAASASSAIWAGAFSVLTMTVRLLALIIVVTLAINGAVAVYDNTTLHTHFDVRTSLTFAPFRAEPEAIPEAIPEEEEGAITRRERSI